MKDLVRLRVTGLPTRRRFLERQSEKQFTVSATLKMRGTGAQFI